MLSADDLPWVAFDPQLTLLSPILAAGIFQSLIQYIGISGLYWCKEDAYSVSSVAAAVLFQALARFFLKRVARVVTVYLSTLSSLFFFFLPFFCVSHHAEWRSR